MPEIVKIDPINPERPLILKAARILREGGIVAYPTETFYGLGADAENVKAIERIYTIKGREDKKPISILIGSKEDITKYALHITERGEKLMNRFWPGALTLVFEASRNVPEILTAGTGKIGIRLSSHAISTHLVQNIPESLTATSANVSGKKECSSAREVMEGLGNAIDAVIDGGTTPGGLGSTILDVTEDPPRILREGIIPISLINEILRYDSVNERGNT